MKEFNFWALLIYLFLVSFIFAYACDRQYNLSIKQNDQLIYRLQQQENELYNLNNQIRELKIKEK